MKKILNVLVLALAMNFLLVVGGGAWLYTSGHLNKEKFADVKKIMFPGTQPATEPSTQPVATSQPIDHIEELLAKASGRPAGEQVDFIRQTFVGEMAEMDRRRRELQDMQREVDFGKQQVKSDRAKIEQAQADLSAQQAEQTRLATDKGFQDSLQLYSNMMPKNVKAIFMNLDDDTVVHYLQAMQPRTSSKILKEFKSPDEISRVQKLMERIRQAPQPTPVQATPVQSIPAQSAPAPAQPGDTQAAAGQ